MSLEKDGGRKEKGRDGGKREREGGRERGSRRVEEGPEKLKQ